MGVFMGVEHHLGGVVAARGGAKDLAFGAAHDATRASSSQEGPVNCEGGAINDNPMRDVYLPPAPPKSTAVAEAEKSAAASLAAAAEQTHQ